VYGPWSLVSSDSKEGISRSTVSKITGNGWIQPVSRTTDNYAYLEIEWAAFGQTIEIEVSANVTTYTSGQAPYTRVEKASINVYLPKVQFPITV
jgi:hypothetical protein